MNAKIGEKLILCIKITGQVKLGQVFRCKLLTTKKQLFQMCGQVIVGIHMKALNNNFTTFFRCVVGADSRASCSCDPGYTGDRCDGCEVDDVCLNGGTCDAKSAVCVCQTGRINIFTD